MRALARQLLAPRERGNAPLGASMATHSGGSGLTTADMNQWLSSIFQQSPSGNHLEQYSRSVPVYFAVKLRGDAVARAPLKAYTTTDKGELQWVGPNHDVQKHLDHVNPWWSHSDMWRAIETYLCLWGSSFTWVNKVGSNPADWEQWVLRPDKVVIVKDREDYIKGFIYDPHGANFAMPPDEVIWDRYFNPLDEFSGLSPLASLMEILPMRQDMIKTNRMLFKNGILAQNLAFMMKGPLTSDQVEQFYQRLEQRHSGADNGNRPIIVDTGVGNVQTLGFSNREMEWMEGLKWAAGDMLTALGVREELYPGSQRTTYHNLSEARQEFYGNTVSSEWEFLEAGRQERFIPMLPARYQGLILRFDTTVVAAMQESIDAKSTRELNEVRFGVRTPDEYRAERGMAPLADGAGAQPYVPSGTTPLMMLGEVPPPTNAPEEPRSLPEQRMIAEVRCPTCSKLTGRDIVEGSGQFCRKCKQAFTASEK